MRAAKVRARCGSFEQMCAGIAQQARCNMHQMQRRLQMPIRQRTLKRRRSSTYEASGFFAVTSASSAFAAVVPATPICASCKPARAAVDGWCSCWTRCIRQPRPTVCLRLSGLECCETPMRLLHAVLPGSTNGNPTRHASCNTRLANRDIQRECSPPSPTPPTSKKPTKKTFPQLLRVCGIWATLILSGTRPMHTTVRRVLGPISTYSGARARPCKPTHAARRRTAAFDGRCCSACNTKPDRRL